MRLRLPQVLSHRLVPPRNAFKALENGDFHFFQVQPCYKDREMLPIRPMRCVRGNASQGDYSCKVVEDNQHPSSPCFRLPRVPVMTVQVRFPQANLRRGELLNTSGWFPWVFPTDWSGYRFLRVDVFLESEETESLMLEVEDDLVEPPVSVTFEAPPSGKWVTLEMDLAGAAKERDLNLRKMNNIWVRVNFKDHTTTAPEMWKLWAKRKVESNKEEWEKRLFVASIDNVRLSGNDTPCAHPIMEGKRSTYTITLPRSYAVQEHYVNHGFGGYAEVVPADAEMPEAAKPAPESGPVEPSAPSIIPIREIVAKGCIGKNPLKNNRMYNNLTLRCTAALDSKRIAVGFTVRGANDLKAHHAEDQWGESNSAAAVGTLDGGKTWRGLNGSERITILGSSHKTPPLLCDVGGDVVAVWDFGCRDAQFGAHVGYPVDRAFCVRSVLTEKGWWISPKYFVTGDPRHCKWVRYANVVGSPSGRIWTAWGASDRYSYDVETDGGAKGSRAVSVYYSDDGGKTWCGWRGPGLTGTMPIFKDGKKLGGNASLAPYRGHVALFSSRQWTWFDGKKWTELEEAGKTHNAVACGKELYISNRTKGPSKWYDGSAWHDLSVPGRTGKNGKIGVCGWKSLVFVESDESGKKLLCWRKMEGSEWQGPEELASEENPIGQLAMQRYAPEGFMPVAYMCTNGGPPGDRKTVYEPWVKVLKVPARQSGTELSY